MNDRQEPHAATDAVVGRRAAEIGTALSLFVVGLVVVGDSLRVGRGWAPDGPETGFYPFYVGLALCAASGWIAAHNLRQGAGPRFVGKVELGRVLSVLVPSMAFVASLYYLGTYLASALFLIGFMHWLGKYAWQKALLVAVAIIGVLFLLFEIWFQVPLPKGPLEAWLGY